MQYTVLVFEAEPDEGGYWAKVVELPGCYTSGETIDEVRTNAIDAIETWIDVANVESRHASPAAVLTLRLD